jgi:hypothetical protein
MPVPEIIEGEGVVFAFVGTCPSEKHDPEKWEPVFGKIMLNRILSAMAL